MFEQSLLLNDSAAKKSGAFAASLTAQILFTGVLMLMPLAYQEVIPLVKLAIPLAAPIVSAAPQPPVESQTHSGTTAAPSLRRPLHMFREPRGVPTAPLQTVAETFDLAPPSVAVGGGLPHLLSGDGGIAVPQYNVAPPNPATATPGPAVQAAPVPVGGAVLAAQLVRKVVPIYPPLARQARISGAVRLEGILSKDGTIRNLRVVSGHPLLVQSALEAVRQWVYRPTLLNGVPVEVIAPIDVVFQLN